MHPMNAALADFFVSETTSMWDALYFTVWFAGIHIAYNAFFCNIVDYWKDILLQEKAVNSLRQLV